MAYSYPEKRGLTDKYIPGGSLADVSTASIAYAPIPAQGVIVDGFCTISAALTTADGTVTVKVIKSGATTTIGTITLTQSGSAAGSTYRMVMSGSEAARSVSAGDTIVSDSNGACDTTSIGVFTYVIRES